MKRTVVTIVIGLLVSPAALSDYLDQPPWAGTSGFETYQGWEFTNDLNPSVIDNPYGDPVLAGGTHLSIYEGREGILYYDAFDSITIDIPNANNDNPVKEIWMQVTYYVFFDFPSLSYAIEGSGGESTRFGSGSIDPTPLGNGWYYEAVHWIIEPNPAAETITLESFFDDIYIDQLHIDTICIPEPASLSMLVGLGLLMIRRR